MISTSRYEMKYLVRESVAFQVREIVKHYLDSDEFANDTHYTSGYLVQSVYLDNPALQLYRQTIRGIRNRFKLRVRVYDDTGPAFLEVKRRENVAVVKFRAKVNRAAAVEAINGRRPHRDWLCNSRNDHEYQNMLYFCELQEEIGAYPAATVAYRRDAFASSNGDARVTFDRQLRGSLAPPDQPFLLTPDAWFPPLNGVVLELKYTNKVPGWMTSLVRQFQLSQVSIPKYVHCIDTMRAAGALNDPRLSRSVG